METLSCKTCTKEFKVKLYKSRPGRGKYCSKACEHEGKKRGNIRICLSCSTPFYAKISPTRANRGKYCSHGCYSKCKEGTVGFWKDKTRETPWMVGENNPMWTGGVVERYYTRARRIGGKHTNKEWEELKKKYSYRCLCCKKQEPLIILTRDHIVPVLLWTEWAKENKPDFLGNDIQNIQPLCIFCNSRKNATYVDYRDLLFNKIAQ